MSEIEVSKTSIKLADTLGGFSDAQIEILKQQVCKGATSMELAYIVQLANSYDLNPFQKEIWAYKDHKGGLVTFVGVDGLIRLASKIPAYGQVLSGAVYSNDKILIDQTKGIVDHSFNPVGDRGELVGAWAKIERTDNLTPPVEYVSFKQYKRSSPTWTQYPDAMIQKVAKATVLRPFAKAFKLYTEEEMDIRNGVIVESQVQDLSTDFEVLEE